MNPLNYGLCQQTVTVYQKKGEEILRTVVQTCYFSSSISTPRESYGKSRSKKFLLIIPGEEISLRPGDRIFAGIGPENVEWQAFLPATVPELYEVSFAKPCYWEGNLTHWEAGNRKETL